MSLSRTTLRTRRTRRSDWELIEAMIEELRLISGLVVGLGIIALSIQSHKQNKVLEMHAHRIKQLEALNLKLTIAHSELVTDLDQRGLLTRK